MPISYYIDRERDVLYRTVEGTITVEEVVQSVVQVRAALRQHPKHVALLVSRDGQQIFVPVNLG